jgi:hypothetical protein
MCANQRRNPDLNYTTMKKILQHIYVSGALLLFMVASCSKDIQDRTDGLASLDPASLDANAGTWKPILLTGPTEFPVSAPIPVSSPDYRLQINEVKAMQANMTKADEELLEYWSAGAALERDHAGVGGQAQPCAVPKSGWNLSFPGCQ